MRELIRSKGFTTEEMLKELANEILRKEWDPISYVASVILIKEYGWARTDLTWKRNEEVLTMEEFMADSNLTEQALVKLQEDSSVELTREESESICLDLIDHLLSDDKELADAVRTGIARVLPKVSQEVKDKIAHKLTIYDL